MKIRVGSFVDTTLDNSIVAQHVRNVVEKIREDLEFKKDTNQIKKAFQIFIAQYIVKTIKDAIHKQKVYDKKMQNIYKELSKKYKEAKNLKHKEHFYRNTSYLYKHIGYWTDKYDNIFIGFKNIHYGSKKLYSKRLQADSYSNVLMWMDRGTRKMIARPLFSVVVTYVKDNIRLFADDFYQLFKNYQQQGMTLI